VVYLIPHSLCSDDELEASFIGDPVPVIVYRVPRTFKVIGVSAHAPGSVPARTQLLNSREVEIEAAWANGVRSHGLSVYPAGPVGFCDGGRTDAKDPLVNKTSSTPKSAPAADLCALAVLALRGSRPWTGREPRPPP